jgi:hypothetical protein
MALSLLIIRHAEKPEENWPGPGLTADGTPDKESLVIRGWQRAGAWAALFGSGVGGADYPVPAAIYAANPAGVGVSQRPFETITALAPRLGITPNTTYAQGQEAGLAQELLGLSGVVLVSWEHKAIVDALVPKIVPLVSGTPPTHWNGSRFDVVLRFDRADGASGFAFRELFPKLLSGDSDKPLG